MPSIPLKVEGFVRAQNVLVPEFSVLAHVSHSQWDSKAESFVERTLKKQYNEPVFEHNWSHGYTFFNRRHNAIKDQMRYEIATKSFVKDHGTFYKYYTTTFDTSANPLTKEDNVRNIDRVFDLPVQPGFNPQNEVYKRFGIQYTDKIEIYIHMALFLERNYQSLREAGIPPECDPEKHDPEWSQRGYSTFNYHGYSAAQIFPKSGDLMKLEYNNILYQVASITDEIPEYEYMWHKFWWKAYLEVATDNGQTVSQDVINSPVNEHFIDNLFGSTVLNDTSSGSPVISDSTGTGNPMVIDKDALIEFKQDVLFRPPEVDECVKDVTNDANYYACSTLMGQW